MRRCTRTRDWVRQVCPPTRHTCCSYPRDRVPKENLSRLSLTLTVNCPSSLLSLRLQWITGPKDLKRDDGKEHNRGRELVSGLEEDSPKREWEKERPKVVNVGEKEGSLERPQWRESTTIRDPRRGRYGTSKECGNIYQENNSREVNLKQKVKDGLR